MKILYQAMDGKIFDTKSKCAEYEKSIFLYSGLSFEKREEIAKFFIDNPKISIKNICEKYGISNYALSKIRKEFDLHQRYRSKKCFSKNENLVGDFAHNIKLIPKRTKDKIVKDYFNKNLTIKNILEKHGITMCMLESIKTEYGLPYYRKEIFKKKNKPKYYQIKNVKITQHIIEHV